LPAPPRERAFNKAAAALLLGAAAFTCFLGPIAGVPAIAFGRSGLHDAKGEQARTGKGMVIVRGLCMTGIILGAASPLIWIYVFLNATNRAL
jgi:hypothetical protein